MMRERERERERKDKKGNEDYTISQISYYITFLNDSPGFNRICENKDKEKRER